MHAWIFLHEIFHRRAHFQAMSHFSPLMEEKNDAEANFFAAVALMPRWSLRHRTVDDICAEYELPRPLVEIRKSIAERYGL
jgi:Zn-dependent peptidase ImmA (M78 family)